MMFPNSLKSNPFNFKLRHSRAGGNPGAPSVRCTCVRWIPACAGMTGFMFLVFTLGVMIYLLL
ncbi:hypothetical protein CbuK_2087 [Coxiella burnetii CbuK_Q154]|nr:hypothetical protein CbuK_2087 [Coxiella burnetii CbuK_Q154]APQ67138.1 hypothetical protein A35_10595 [Coxiella burnetii 'MSU Goat Q177']